MDARGEFKEMIHDEKRGAVVLTFANTFTTGSGKKLTAVHTDTDLWWGYADGAGDDSVITVSKVQGPASGAGRGPADMHALRPRPRVW